MLRLLTMEKWISVHYYCSVVIMWCGTKNLSADACNSCAAVGVLLRGITQHGGATRHGVIMCSALHCTVATRGTMIDAKMRPAPATRVPATPLWCRLLLSVTSMPSTPWHGNYACLGLAGMVFRLFGRAGPAFRSDTLNLRQPSS